MPLKVTIHLSLPPYPHLPVIHLTHSHYDWPTHSLYDWSICPPCVSARYVFFEPLPYRNRLTLCPTTVLADNTPHLLSRQVNGFDPSAIPSSCLQKQCNSLVQEVQVRRRPALRSTALIDVTCRTARNSHAFAPLLSLPIYSLASSAL